MPTVVSVLIPCFNAEKWLRCALYSVLRQPVESLEVIVVNDGSNDSTAEMLRATQRHDQRLRVIDLPGNRGIVHALNLGLDETHGSVVARMDADDICSPNRLARQLAFLHQTGVDACGSWFIEFGQGIPRTVRWPHTEAALRAAMLFQNTICHPTVMARREVFERFRYREEYRLAEDYDLFARACGEFRIANIPEPLLRYRRHATQTTQAQRNKMEVVTRRIRLEALRSQGIDPTVDEQRLHNMIRAPVSIHSVDDLMGIEAWLRKLYEMHRDVGAQHVIASQWMRACIRAAPLGRAMLRIFRGSPLCEAMNPSIATQIDLWLLGAAQLDYRSPAFATLRRFGLSA